jgi:large conductance mechanosensitive channel
MEQPLNAAKGAAGKALSLADEFKKFALKGNVIDLAVGVIIGAAFGKIVDSLVKNIFMPLISTIMPGSSTYESWAIGDIKIGLVIGDIISFVAIALVLFFVVVKFLGAILNMKKKEAEAAPPAPTEVELLIEIRDLLKKQPEQNS